ncbi:hypothetical protein C8R43DRAFT_899692 [Mycena crocata]|nr:hypothetical protein C8R43DRAFT_899692 [Mycena crocata]
MARDECLAEYCALDFASSLSLRDVPTPVFASRINLCNAERFRRGMPPAPPTSQYSKGTGKRNEGSPTPTITLRGRIKVINTANNAVLGYISKNPLSGTLRYQSNMADAVTVHFDLPLGALTVKKINIAQEDSDIFPLVGAIQGRDNTSSDIAPGSFHYGYIGGTNECEDVIFQLRHSVLPSSGPNSYTAVIGTQRTFESAVWVYDTISKAIIMQWINIDGSTFSTALYFGGDKAAFQARYSSPVSSIRFSFEEILIG